MIFEQFPEWRLGKIFKQFFKNSLPLLYSTAKTTSLLSIHALDTILGVLWLIFGRGCWTPPPTPASNRVNDLRNQQMSHTIENSCSIFSTVARLTNLRVFHLETELQQWYLEDLFGGLCNRSLIGWKPVSIVHYIRLRFSIKQSTQK